MSAPQPIPASRFLWAKAAALGAGAMLSVILISCGTVERTVMAPPTVPGATYVGTKSCEECHEAINQGFVTASHARLLAPGPNAIEMGCESCHGPGSLHVESGGVRGTILNPKKSPDTCFQCHLDKRGEFNLPYSHPVAEGRLSCNDCHDSHTGSLLQKAGLMAPGDDQGCLACHQAQHGPFVFEHEAMREGCTACHRPHGSVNAKLLVQRNQSLCLKCHFQQQQAGGQLLIGGVDHTSFVRQGTCWSGGCHEAVHGSQVNSSLRY
ncbi:MAG: cytochrome c3 family protein [Limisphaerales bacterium]